MNILPNVRANLVRLALAALLASFAQGGLAGEARPGGKPSLAALDVPLTIHEMAGVARRADVCSTGVPLPCGLLKEPAGIAVFSPSGQPVPAQFRVLERWRERGRGRADLSVKWLLVTFLADVPKGGKAVYRLKAGENPLPAKPVKIEKTGDAYRMGGLVFKRDLTAPFGLVLTGPEGKQIATDAQDIKWSIWEQGPVRACLKAESPTAAGKLGFIVWIYAYAGQKRWDMTVVLKNTPRKSRGPFYFKDFSVAWQPSGLKDAKGYLLGGEWGKAASGKLTGGKSASLYQASDGGEHWATLKGGPKARDWSEPFVWSGAYARSGRRLEVAKKGQPEFRGYRVLEGARKVADGNFAQGWAALSGGQDMAFACLRYFRQQFPKAAEVGAGSIALRLWPKYWKGHGGVHWLDDQQRKAHDLSFRLLPAAGGAKAGEAAARAFDCPLVVHCGREWYRASGACTYLDYTPPEVAARKPQAIEKQELAYDNWVTLGGKGSHWYKHHPSGGPFVLSGDPGDAYYTFTLMRWSAAMNAIWLDDYRFPADKRLMKIRFYQPHPRSIGKYREGTAHHNYGGGGHYRCGQHFHNFEQFDSWRLLGDPLALDGVRNLGVCAQFSSQRRQTAGGSEARADRLPLINLCQAYRLTGDEAFLKSAVKLGAVSWKQVNKQRGWYANIPTDKKRLGNTGGEKPWMMGYLMSGLRDYYALSGDENTADQLTGMADFIIVNAMAEKDGHARFTYVASFDQALQAKIRDKLIGSMKKRTKSRMSQSADPRITPSLAWCYLYTGDEFYKKAAELAGDKVSRYSSPRTDREAPAAVKDLRAQALGGGKLKLTWTAPGGAPARYQLKWAEKPMVERLKWPEEKATKCNWWAAHNVPAEPQPAAAGTGQSMLVEGVSAGERCFNLRSFDAASNRSAMSNMVTLEVK